MMTINEVVNGYFEDKSLLVSNITTMITNVKEIREMVYPNGNINALPIDSLEQAVDVFSYQGQDDNIQSIQDGVEIYNKDRQSLNKIYNDLMAIVAQVNNDYAAKSHKGRTVSYDINPLGTESVTFDSIDDAINQYDNDFHLAQNAFTQAEEEIDDLYNDVEEWYEEVNDLEEGEILFDPTGAPVDEELVTPSIDHVDENVPTTNINIEAKDNSEINIYPNIIVSKPSMGSRIKNFFRKIFG
jgi:prefoldin subunit 5